MEPARKFKRIAQEDLRTRSKNEQNYQIALGYQRLNDVLLALMKQGLTVTSVHIQREHPVIQLLDAPTPEQLRSSVQRTRCDAEGRRWIEHNATINGCTVQWRLPLLH